MADRDMKDREAFSRRIKKEHERLAKRFKVITPAEFEAGPEAQMALRAGEADSWAQNNTQKAQTTPGEQAAAG